MSRSLSVFLPIATPLADAHAVLSDDPAGWLPLGSRPAGPRLYRVTLGALKVRRPVVVTVGGPWSSDGGVWRRLSWYPAADAGDVLPVEWALPSFDGEIGLEAAGAGGTTLILNGRYEVPGRKVGELVDAMALSGIARRTADNLLSDVAARIAERVAAAAPPTAVGGL